MTIHSTVIGANNELIKRRIDENFGLGSDWAFTELTIASGVVTSTSITHLIDTESDAASDDLDTISGGIKGQSLRIMAANDARTIVVKHGTGNIMLEGAADFSLDSDDDYVDLMYNGTNWHGKGVSI